MKSRWYGKTKYNRDYYTLPTEVFVRTGEIYFQIILGLENSLVDIKDNVNLIYPTEDKEFLNMIKTYFTSIFGNVGVKETKVVANVSVNTTISTKIASKVENLMVFVEKSSGQLSLF